MKIVHVQMAQTFCFQNKRAAQEHSPRVGCVNITLLLSEKPRTCLETFEHFSKLENFSSK